MGWLEGVSAIVTGGGSGIGKGIVERFVEEGAQVTAVDRVEDRVIELAGKFPGKVIGVGADVSSFEDNVRSVEEAVKAFGKLDVFIGNAGIWDFSRGLADTPGEDLASGFDELFGVNVKGNLLGAKAALPELTKTEGNMIFTTSNAGFWPGGGGPIYTASKHAMVGLIRQLAFELTPTIRVNGVAPGGTVTDLRGLSALGQAETSLSSLFQTPSGEAIPGISPPEDHAAAYVFLASKQNSPNTTGAVLDSTSGMLPTLMKMAMSAMRAQMSGQ